MYLFPIGRHASNRGAEADGLQTEAAQGATRRVFGRTALSSCQWAEY